MKRTLGIKKNEDESMISFRRRLEELLQEIGLENFGRLDFGESNTPATYGFESSGEGGFILTYVRGLKISDRNSPAANPYPVDVFLSGFGSSDSLIQRTYEHLRKNIPESQIHEARE